jgi:hypothetical protein
VPIDTRAKDTTFGKCPRQHIARTALHAAWYTPCTIVKLLPEGTGMICVDGWAEVWLI